MLKNAAAITDIIGIITSTIINDIAAAITVRVASIEIKTTIPATVLVLQKAATTVRVSYHIRLVNDFLVWDWPPTENLL